MRQTNRTAQAGYAMLLTVLALMGIGGAVLAGFTQSVKKELEVQRYQHNQRVLQQAKQALLMFAYHYPQTNPGIGPGRLPCPDNDNDINGTIEFPPDCNPVGRFPWGDARLGIQETLDASGERLWYAVSDAFGNFPTGIVINSSTTGTVTLVDQSGGIIYDGAIAGIAAVIIAPGPILNRDEDANGSYEYIQLRDTAAQKIDPRNYLDTFDGFDNAVFTNGESNSNDDGFIMGPVYDTTESMIVVNDQLVIITADEVIAMAEMATLEAYRTAILDYLSPGKTNGVYPWLYNYEGVEYDTGVGETNDDAVAKLSTFFPADSDFVAIPNYHDDNGRIPSIFAEYFTRTGSRPVESDLKVTLTIDYDAITPVPATISHGNLPLTGDGINPAVHVLEFTIPAADLTDLRFTQDADAPNGRLTATLAAAQTFNQPLYFWDEDEVARTDVWRLCPGGGDELSDCHRDGAQNSTPGGANDSREEILILDIEVSLPAGTITFDADYSTAPTLAYTEADANGHALVSATMQGTDLDLDPLTSPSITVSWQYDDHYHEDDPLELFAIGEQGDLVLADLLGNTTMALEMRYFPELPAWAYDNDWHNSIRMAYAEDHRPGVAGDCNVAPDDDCLKVNDPEQSGPRDYVSLLLIGHGHDWLDNDEALPGIPSVEDGSLSDELRDVFDEGNHNGNSTYYTRRNNDRILVIEKL